MLSVLDVMNGAEKGILAGILAILAGFTINKENKEYNLCYIQSIISDKIGRWDEH